MGGFRAKGPPEWASQPCRLASVETHTAEGIQQTVHIDKQPAYVLGREAGAVDVVLSEPSTSREHAAIVHHADGRLFLIDLASSHGTMLDGRPVPKNKPVELKNGSKLRFGNNPAATHIVRCEASGEKRRSREDAETPEYKRQNSSGSGGIVRASHLLVKHRNVRRPSSWKEPTVTRSPEEALAMVKTFREQLISSSDEQQLADNFARLASTESHCSSAKRGGDLGPFGPGQMQAAFDEGTRALQIGELSQPVSSDSGWHLILRTAV
mmetsp:Transcript_20183/g.60882  ORF Transcript_20183/g.60882 Transcript_20183/m.60882 type:complete len:267 (-) Transcript_20183:1163-1963(-)